VTIAEPLAYIPELQVMVQGPVPEEHSLEDLLHSAMKSGDQTDLAELHRFTRMAARGIAAVHGSAVQYGETATWEAAAEDVRELLERIALPLPGIAEAAAPILGPLESLAGQSAPGAPVPTHGTFAPEQVPIAADKVGLIDFDDFCMSEPAMDVGLFYAGVFDSGMSVEGGLGPGAEARLALLDSVAETFLSEYERHAPISRERVMLWAGVDFLKHGLQCWTKVKPAGPAKDMLLLEHHLRKIGLI
jgi:aminoglycoside phosphotransferase (APT) family kinase protein